MYNSSNMIFERQRENIRRRIAFVVLSETKSEIVQGILNKYYTIHVFKKN